ncbi:hypothetical protein GM658_19745 [Pseudoduganella eburnea]|uniref:Tetratricopeptide repeat protein n=1 Tax=Massilia eburnea TaxID=1776165 RepID=A0A6L6QKZ2_9BURK|nr:hypothetical protein [Massilia eburnea]MTW12845.1 hypothetical protein [Massilia eburnea]
MIRFLSLVDESIVNKSAACDDYLPGNQTGTHVTFNRGLSLLSLLSLLAACATAQADCPTTLPLKGVINLDNCYPIGADCVPAAEALYQYTLASPDVGDEVLSISLHGSPWHFYGPDSRIMTIENMAGMVKQQGSKIHEVILMASWSGASPDKHRRSLAQQLSSALGDMKVSGPNGFLWYEKDGKTAVTQQAFTVFKTGPYAVKKGEKVMASLVEGWPAQFEDTFAKQRDAQGLLRAGVGHEVFSLCPSRALAAFDASAALGNPIAAYNAAILRLERGDSGDREAALALLRKAATAGDRPSATLLEQTTLRSKGKP